MSARLDGEDPGVPAEILDAHLAWCPSCQAWARDLTALHRLARIRPAEAVPDLSAAILAAAPAAPRPRVARPPFGREVSWSRWALLAVALAQLVLALPVLVSGDAGGASVHVARELGAFDVALAAGLLLAAWQPARAWGLLPVMLVLGFVIAATSALDLAEGSASSGGEAHHVLDVAGLALLWLVARERPPVEARRA